MRAIALLGLLALVKAAPPIGILPVTDCPEDSSDPVVVLSSHLNGQPIAANQYIVCLSGRPTVLNCPEGLFFNSAILTCDFPYERRSNGESIISDSEESGELGDLDNLIPAGPIPVPISPQYPIPIWTKSNTGVIRPLPPYPITRPDPSQVRPLPVQQNKLPPTPQRTAPPEIPLPPLPPLPVPIPGVPNPPEIPLPPLPSLPVPIPELPRPPLPPLPIPRRPVRLNPPYPLPLPDPSVYPMPPVIPARPPPLIPRPVPYQ